MEQLHPTVLLVNDDAETSEALSFLLERDGYEVKLAINGEEALQKLRQGLRPGLIVLDLMMPVMDGFEFRYEQMKDPDLSAIPVIVCSAAMDPREAATQLRAAGYVQLTDPPKHLRALVRQYCLR